MAAPWGRSRDVETPNAIVGAARRVNLTKRDEVESLRERGTAEWQELGWRYFDLIGEIKSAYNYFAAISSRVRIYAGYQADSGSSPVPLGESPGVDRSLVIAARYEMDKLSKGRGGQPNMIRAFVLNLLVAGECYLVGDNNQWAVRSTSELRFEADGRTRLIRSRDAKRLSDRDLLSEQAFVARIWRTHPQFSDDADSSVKGILGDCQELLLLSRLIRASARSRLSAGLLYVADELRFQRSQDAGTGSDPQPDVDPLEEELEIALTDPIGDSDSPSEVTPLLIRGPAALAEGIKKIDLSRGFDETIVKRYEQTLRRILTGLDIPSDLVTGLANVRYSNARTISEDLLKAHIEPMIVLICEALTTAFLRPQLLARGFKPEEVAKIQVWYDPSEVVTRPDRSEDADKGFERMLIKGATWRRSHGFSELDAPSNEEVVRRIALAGNVAPSTTLDFMRLVAPNLVDEAERLAAESFGDPSRATSGAPVPTQPGAGPGSGRVPVDPAQPNPDARAVGDTSPPEGGLPPGTNDDNSSVLSVKSQREDRLLEMLTAMTAAAAISRSPEARDRERRLERGLEVERRLRESLFVHLNDVVFRSLERAGARTVSKVRGDSAMKSLVSEVPLEAAFSQIPEDQRATFALNEDGLIRDSIEKAKTGYFDLVMKAQEQGWNALGGDTLEKMRDTQLEHLEKSWAWLVAKLVSLATKWLRSPKTRGSYVSMQTVRDAATLAGGGSHVPNADKASQAPASVAQDDGRAVLSVLTLESTGWELSERYRWVYGVSENSYEPHVQLDDTVFDSWSAKELASPDPDAWPYVTHHFPGDHDGCRCDWLPEVLDPAQVNAAEPGQTWEEPIAASAAPQ